MFSVILMVLDKKAYHYAVTITIQIVFEIAIAIWPYLRRDLGRKCFPVFMRAAAVKGSWLITMINLLKWYFAGLLITAIFTSSARMAIGRLRPHFLDVCKPNFTEFACSDSEGHPLYVTEYKCYGDSEEHMIAARQDTCYIFCRDCAPPPQKR